MNYRAFAFAWWLNMKETMQMEQKQKFINLI